LEIRLKARFKAFGADVLVLIECKHYKNPVKREIVQLLRDRIRTTGAHKGMIFSTSRYQRGAVEYATKHGIALIIFVEGKSTYMTRAHGNKVEPPPWANIPKISGWITKISDDGNQSFSIVSRDHGEYLSEFLKG
jgi:restriction system protein